MASETCIAWVLYLSAPSQSIQCTNPATNGMFCRTCAAGDVPMSGMPTAPGKPPPPCQVSGCKELSVSGSLCVSHRQEWHQKNGWGVNR